MHSIKPKQPASKSGPDPLEILADALAPYLIPKLQPKSPADDLFDLSRSPAGKRAAYVAARHGKIDGARRIKRRWWAPKPSHDRWLESISTAPAEPTVHEAAPSPVDALAARLGLRRVG